MKKIFIMLVLSLFVISCTKKIYTVTDGYEVFECRDRNQQKSIKKDLKKLGGGRISRVYGTDSLYVWHITL